MRLFLNRSYVFFFNMATKKKELSGRKERRWTNGELLRTKSVCNSFCEWGGFSGGPGNSSLKKSSHNESFEHIKRKFDKSLKNRQVQEKVELELGKFKRCLRTDVRPRKKAVWCVSHLPRRIKLLHLVRLISTQDSRIIRLSGCIYGQFPLLQCTVSNAKFLRLSSASGMLLACS